MSADLPPLGTSGAGDALRAHNRRAAMGGRYAVRVRPSALPPEVLATLTDLFGPFLERHVDHAQWEQIGRCVYCGCGVRLYQGTLPEDRQS